MKDKKSNADLEKRLVGGPLHKDNVTVNEYPIQKEPEKRYIVIFNGDQAKILKHDEIGPFVGRLYLTGDKYVVYELGRKMKVKFKTPELEFIGPEDGHGF